MTVIEALQRAPLFKEFSRAGLETFAEVARPRAVAAGSAVFEEGAAGEALLVIVSGTLRVSQRAAQGGERELATLGPGQHLGTLGLLAKTVHLVSATAATDLELLELPRREFFKKAQEKPVTCLKLAAVIAGDLARSAAESQHALRELMAHED